MPSTGRLSVPIDITSIDIHLSGIVGGKGFMRNPTSCGVKTTELQRRLIRAPEPEGHRAGHVHVDELRRAAVLADVHGRRGIGWPHAAARRAAGDHQDPAGRGRGRPEERAGAPAADPQCRHRAARRTRVPSPSSAPTRRSCPAKSIVGSASAISPFLPAPETGLVVIVAGARPADLPRLGVDLRGPLALQLFGIVRVPSGRRRTARSTAFRTSPSPTSPSRFKAGGLADQRRGTCAQPPKPVFPRHLHWLERRHPDQQGERHRSRMQLT